MATFCSQGVRLAGPKGTLHVPSKETRSHCGSHSFTWAASACSSGHARSCISTVGLDLTTTGVDHTLQSAAAASSCTCCNKCDFMLLTSIVHVQRCSCAHDWQPAGADTERSACLDGLVWPGNNLHAPLPSLMTQQLLRQSGSSSEGCPDQPLCGAVNPTRPWSSSSALLLDLICCWGQLPVWAANCPDCSLSGGLGSCQELLSTNTRNKAMCKSSSALED